MIIFRGSFVAKSIEILLLRRRNKKKKRVKLSVYFVENMYKRATLFYY